jgi:hypothetical protein
MTKFYEEVIDDILDSISEMRLTGDYDENTLETIEWRISAPKEIS